MTMNAAATLLRRAAPSAPSASAASASASRALATGPDEPLRRTALNDLHKELGGDMVPFAGYELPVLYKGENGGVMKEHLWCRGDGKSALFDVSHMGQVGWNDTYGATSSSSASQVFAVHDSPLTPCVPPKSISQKVPLPTCDNDPPPK